MKTDEITKIILESFHKNKNITQTAIESAPRIDELYQRALNEEWIDGGLNKKINGDKQVLIARITEWAMEETGYGLFSEELGVFVSMLSSLVE